MIKVVNSLICIVLLSACRQPGSPDKEASFRLEADGELLISLLDQEIRVNRDMVQSNGSKGLLPGKQETQDIRILADRSSIEVFANRGSMTMAFCLVPKESPGDVTVRALKGRAVCNSLSVREVSSIWKDRKNLDSIPSMLKTL